MVANSQQMVAKLDKINSNSDFETDTEKYIEFYEIQRELTSEIIAEYSGESVKEIFGYDGCDLFFDTLELTDRTFNYLEDDEYSEAFNLLSL